FCFFFFFQAEDGIRDFHVTGVQTCALPISFASLGAWTVMVSAAILDFAEFNTDCARSYACSTAGLALGGMGSRSSLRSISVPSTTRPSVMWHSPRRPSTTGEG